MAPRYRTLLGLVALASMFASSAFGAVTLSPDDISWQTLPGSVVQFHLRFRNPDLVPTSAASYAVHSQSFGVFLPDQALIADGDIPPIEPESFFDVFFEVPLASLPPSPPTQFDAGMPSPIELEAGEPCPPDDHWDGNIDVNWFGPDGAGQVNHHHGTLQVCAGSGSSYLHLLTACPGNITWSIKGLCPGFGASLLNEDFSAAPAVLPAGWTGWIRVTIDASVAAGTVCCFQLNFTCGGVTTAIQLCVTACKCPPTAIERKTWGEVKTIYR